MMGIGAELAESEPEAIDNGNDAPIARQISGYSNRKAALPHACAYRRTATLSGKREIAENGTRADELPNQDCRRLRDSQPFGPAARELTSQYPKNSAKAVHLARKKARPLAQFAPMAWQDFSGNFSDACPRL
jgi:hypothetical protein